MNQSEMAQEARVYARNYLAKYGTRPYEEMWFVEAKRFLVRHATDALKRGQKPNIPPLDDWRINEWKKDVASKGWANGEFENAIRRAA